MFVSSVFSKRFCFFVFFQNTRPNVEDLFRSFKRPWKTRKIGVKKEGLKEKSLVPQFPCQKKVNLFAFSLL